MIKNNLFEKVYIDFIYRVTTIITFMISMLYLLLFFYSIKLLLVKTIMNLIYFFVSCKKVFKFKDEEGVVGILGSILIFTLGLYY